LVIGPAFLRALARYRRRLEVRWERSPAPVALGAVALALVLAVPAAAAGATPAARAERYLVRAQNEDGGFGAAPGQRSSPLYSGWAGLALGSAGRNPRDVKRPGGRSLAGFVLRGSGSLRDIGEIERTALLAKVAGLDLRRFGGRDLLAEIESRRRGDGSISGFVSYTAFGVMALRAGGASAGSATVSWLVGSQNADGGFGVARSSASDSDMTGAAVQALATVGRRRGAATQRAVEWLRANQNDDGGFGQFRGRDSNSQSTSYAIQGLLAAGAANGTVSRSRAYLLRLQRADGSVAYSPTGAQTPVWVTAQALMALEGRPLPLASVPRKKRRPPRASARAAPGEAAPAPPAKKKKKAAKPAPGPEPVDGAAAVAKRDADRLEGRTSSALKLDPARARGDGGEGGGVSALLVILGVCGVLGLLWLFRRRLLPGRP
ncbi:MAG TPA: prenyltransferase/squalene oxidase repeat-containing protein, partial [Thermoleophilaceae bacterium]|nr:prenyltransferase/squalene oxidase repeat-containing protein [Thermoleophilaceae bacterium]